jgi:hypothetical protein
VIHRPWRDMADLVIKCTGVALLFTLAVLGIIRLWP